MTFLTEAQIAQFEDQGYLLVKGLLSPEDDLDPIIAEYHDVLDNLAADLLAAGAISSTYEDLPFSERLVKIYGECGKVHAQYFDFALPQGNVKPDTPMWVGPAVFETLRNEKLLDAVESLIGPEIYSNPVQHVRLKPPEALTPRNPETGQLQLGATPWHQDNGVVMPEADETQMLTVWFPLWDAPVESGCLQVVPYSHREGLYQHCPGHVGGLQIPQQLFRVGDAVPVPMERGDVLFLTSRTCHASLSNVSDKVRWSFDLRYNPTGQPTGRGAFPGFVARSRANPESELRKAEDWAGLWYETRRRLSEEQLKGPFNRWNADDPACA